MFNLSLTACSFHLKKSNSKGNSSVFNLNTPLKLRNGQFEFANAHELFSDFFKNAGNLYKDNAKQQTFRCEYNECNLVETNDYCMCYVKIYSGVYGSSSDIVDGNTQELLYKKQPTDIDTRPFYLMVVFPKDSERVVVQKGLFIFQNVGPYGVKTITTTLMQEYFYHKYNITLKCNTIAPDLFVRKVIRRDNIKKLLMIKNMKSSDLADNIGKGYGTEVREISDLRFNETAWNRIMEKIRYVAGGRFNLFEFEQIEYDNLKVVVDIGGRNRTISLHNLDSLSIIEAIPDEIKMADGHPNLNKLIEYFSKVATEYLDEMVLQIN